MIRKIKVFFILGAILLSPYLEAQTRALNEYISSFNSQVTQEETLTFTGSYESGHSSIKEISLYYSSKEPMELTQAKEFFEGFIQQFLQGLNDDIKLKAQLNPYPFTEKGLDVVIFFRNKKGKYATSPNIAQISMQKGVITYYKYFQGKFDVVKQETIH